jgi:hypothetical protein
VLADSGAAAIEQNPKKGKKRGRLYFFFFKNGSVQKKKIERIIHQ